MQDGKGKALEPIGYSVEQWVCVPNAIICQNNHLLRHADSRFIVDQRRVDGHVFLGCRKCEPTSYFFGVVSSRPSPIVQCYAITREQFDHWQGVTTEPLPTHEMLFLLGYNTRYRPTQR